MAIKITSQEFTKKFGSTPTANSPQPVQSNPQDFLSKSTTGQIFSPETANEVPNALYNTFVQKPLKFAKSAIEAPMNIAQSLMGKPQTSNTGKGLMGEDITSYQQDFQNSTLPQVESGQTSPLQGTINTVADVGSGALDTLGAEGLAKGGLAGARGVVNTTGKALKNTVPAINTTGRALKGLGESAYGVTVVPEESTRLAMQNYQAKKGNLFERVKGFIKNEAPEGKPITESNTAARKGLMGTEWGLGVQAKQTSDEIWKGIIQPKLAQVKGKVNIKSFLGEVEKDISKSGGDITRRNSLKEALNSLKEDYKNVGGVSLEKLQDYKSGWAELLPDATYNGKPISAALKEVHNLMAQKARDVIYKHIGEEGKQAYIDWGNLQSIKKAGIKSIGDPAKKSFSKDVWEFVMNKAVTPIATTAGKVLYKTGEGLEFVGKKGAKKVSDIIQN